MTARKLFAAAHSILRLLRNPSDINKRLTHYGIGRLILNRMRFYSPLFSITVKGLRLIRIAVDPFGYFYRKKLARELSKHSKYKQVMPSDKGFAILPPGTFEAVDQIIPEARSLYHDFYHNYVEMDRITDRHSSLLSYSPINGYLHGRVDLREYPNFQSLAEYRPFIEIASTYLGEFPILGSIDLQMILPSLQSSPTTGEKDLGSQEFHIDSGGSAGRQVKCFIPIEDINEKNGATLFLDATTSRKLADSISYRAGRIPDKVVFSNPWQQYLVSTNCPSGSVIFLDSYRTIHCGGRVTLQPRVMITLQYVSPYVAAETALQRKRFDFDIQRALANNISKHLFNL
tara:strand:- start:5595 stop:6626 length:1032 start_codon:yes stop_codon:yes gene_type:complete